jgi:hypothetical protein
MADNLLAKDFLVEPFARHKETTILRVINMAIPCPRTYNYTFCVAMELFLIKERISTMAKSRHHYYTEEEKAEILSNPYTARMTDCRVYFTLEFKQLVMDNVGNAGMTTRKIFRLAGYEDRLFTSKAREYTIKKIIAESKSPEGLREPKTPSKTSVTKQHISTEVKDLQDRVRILEQQIEFLKKSQHLKKQDRSKSQDNSS